MKSTYRTFFFVLILGLPFGYNPVTDTMSQALNLDFLVGRSDYYTGCESPKSTIDFQELHAGYRAETSHGVAFHVDGGLVPTETQSVEGYQGRKATFGYLVGGTDIDWNWGEFGIGGGNIKPFFAPYLRLGPRRILYVDAGLSHRFPLASSGVVNLGFGSGFGTDKVDLWVGWGGDMQCGGLSVNEFGGYSASLNLRLSETIAIKLGGLRGNNNSESTWLGMSYYFK